MTGPYKMKSFFKKILLFFILTLCYINIAGQETHYGLSFKSYETLKEDRTELVLTSKPFTFSSKFALSFDIKFHSSRLYAYGYITRIINNEGQHIDLLLTRLKETGGPAITCAYSSLPNNVWLNIPFKEEKISYDKWLNIKIVVDPDKNILSGFIDNEEVATIDADLEKFLQDINIVFGKTSIPKFQTTDVPAMTIKNIIVSNKDKPVYRWALSKHLHNVVYDELQYAAALCKNPEWVIDKHVVWKNEISFETNIYSQICFNAADNEIAVYNQNLFTIYNFDTQKLRKIKVTNPLTFRSHSNNLIYNPIKERYECYTFEKEAGQDVIYFDTVSHSWNKTLDIKMPPDYWQHNRIFSELDTALYMFGGYGHHKYKNEINKYDYKSETWEKLFLNGDTVYPRYLSGVGMLDNQNILIFGGYGSPNGSQELSSQYFYDLHKVNLKTLKANKIWTLSPPEIDFVPAGSIIIDKNEDVFYALTFPSRQFHTKLSLMKFSLNRPEYTIVADSLPLRFEDTKTIVDLFLDKSGEKLIVTACSPSVDSKVSTVSIYTLAYSPLQPTELYQDIYTGNSHWYWLIACIFILLGLAFLFLYKKRQKNVQTIEDDAETTPAIELYPVEKKVRKKSIYLFGGFQVISKAGQDITKEFTPLIKQIFILILLYTVNKKGKGISSVKLKETFWFDKSDQSAKNNRGVALNKLRQIFEEIGDISILSKDSYWTIELADDVYCDYMHAVSLSNTISQNMHDAKDNIEKLLSIVSAGELLPNLQTEWIDPFKSDFSNELVDLLLRASQQPNIGANPQLCIHIADTIFLHDSLNEDALKLKCSALIKTGKNGMAQKAYSSFAKEYKLLFNADFAYSFDRIITN